MIPPLLRRLPRRPHVRRAGRDRAGQV